MPSLYRRGPTVCSSLILVLVVVDSDHDGTRSPGPSQPGAGVPGGRRTWELAAAKLRTGGHAQSITWTRFTVPKDEGAQPLDTTENGIGSVGLV
eukprot:2307100-Rhodomonas_salina.1